MSTDLETYRDGVRSWLRDADVPAPPRSGDERFTSHRAWQRTLYDAGFVGVAWPSEWGGQGLTLRHQQVVNEELARVRAPHPIGLIGLEVVGPSIGRFGTPEQRTRFLPSLLSGDDIWCQGFSEPGAGSDLAAISTRAVRDGDDLVVTGQKVWTSWAHKASWCAVVARTDQGAERHRGLSYLLVDMRSRGVEVRPLVQITGEAEFNEVFFDDVRVPASNLLGEAGAGWAIAMDSLSHERGTYVLRRRTEVSNAFHAALDHVEDPAALSEQLVTSVGAAEVGLRTLQAQTWATMARLEAGVSAPALDSIDKTVLTKVEQQVGHSVRDLLGTSVSAWDAEGGGGTALRDYLFSRAISIYSGTHQIQSNIIAQRHLGLPRD
jgi:alkylation response protein AidB-like acyl-CoA dehydrogenase